MKSSKIIDISKATLISLKAELSRKHEEVKKARIEAQASFIHPVNRQKKLNNETKKSESKEVIEKDVESIREEEELHKKSRSALEAKARLYEQLSQASSSSFKEEDNSGFLVDFEQKNAENKGKGDLDKDKDRKEVESENDASSCESDDEWIDYTDCLGRTRRCLKCDLDFVKEKDEQLAKSLGFHIDTKGTEEQLGEKKNLNSDPTLNDVQLEQMRKKWEEQEEILRDKKDIHYQDVLFDEARTHGVGYFAFAQNEDTRRLQQEALSKLRDDTKRQQEAAKETRRRREAALKARVRAARNRQRARMGLPPEVEDEVVEDDTKEKEDEEAKRAAQIESDRIAKQEEELKKLQTLRPWDEGKDRKKPFEEMSQEDWVKKKRSERNEEFAPPQLYDNNKRKKDSVLSTRAFDEKGCRNETGPSSSSYNSTLSTFENKKNLPQIANSLVSISEDICIDLTKPPPDFRKTNYKVRHSSEDIRNKVQHKLQKIVNEVSNPIEISSDEESTEDSRGRGVEIAPPASCEYYGLPPIPVVKKGQKETSMSEIEKSISVGLKFLRKQQDKKNEKMEKSQLDFL